MSDLSVRPASIEDLEIIVANNIAMARETEGKALDPDTVRRGTRAALKDPALGFYFLAERGGRVVGQLMITFEWSDWRDAVFWWIQSVYVAPEARRGGVYRALYQRVLEEARRAGNVCGIRLYVERHNAGAQATYRSMGMSPTVYEMYEVDFPIEPGR